jgi:asparagine synthase (glutamine-hydrolysing)
MCGFTGKIWLEAGRPADVETAERMGALVAHRGPDEARTLAVGEAAFAFRRLSIIDVEGGHQPIRNEDGRYTLVFNGEVYNYRELMKELEGRGHRFATRCDAEVVVHLYEERGAACVEALEGMFAFAIWDRDERVLFMARDRTGKKPLYWAVLRDCFVFASELKALPQERSFERRLDRRALAEYLTWQYVPAPRTILEGASKLEPATRLRVQFDAGGGMPEIRSERYWALRYQPKLELEVEAAEEQVREHLDRAVARRLESEAPLGVLLSGGIDSSSIVAMARRHVTGPLRTFSIGFEESSHNELPYARRVARRYETEHEEFMVRPEAMGVLPRLVWHADEPFGDSSALPTWHLSEMTKRRVTVALGGDGGDESFAGYARYASIPVVSIFGKLPRALRAGPMRAAIGAARRRAVNSTFLAKLSLLNEVTLQSPGRQYSHWLTIFPSTFVDMTWAGSGEHRSPSPVDWLEAEMDASDATDAVDRKMACDIATYLPGDLLLKIDRMSMAHGLEVRCPFLDRELMEFAARLPAALKFPGGELKGLLKDAMQSHLPEELLDRPKKGFSVPLHKWFRKELRQLPEAILLSERAKSRGLFRPEGVHKLIEQHHKGAFGHAHRLWTLIAFEVWAQTFLDPANAPTGPLDGIEMGTGLK